MVAGIIILLTVLSVVGCIKVKNPTAKLLLGEYVDDEYKEKDVELIAWKTVKGTYTDTEHVKFNIYHVSPHETNNPDEFVTEVCYAVK